MFISTSYFWCQQKRKFKIHKFFWYKLEVSLTLINAIKDVIHFLKQNLYTTFRSSHQTESLDRRRRLEGHPLQVRHKQDWGRGFILFYPRLLYCPDQMLAVMLLSQHQVSSSKTVRPRAPCGAQCIGHAIRTCYAVCLVVPNSQFDEGARPHLSPLILPIFEILNRRKQEERKSRNQDFEAATAGIISSGQMELGPGALPGF